MDDYIIEMLGITKEFPGIIANDNITLQLKKGEIHALLGENGAGKSTLMSVLFGLYQPEKGIIKVRGREVKIKGPLDANALGIGMVHQHFKLVHNFTVLQNIVLGMETVSRGFLKMDNARKKVVELSERYGLYIDPDALIQDITVGMQQRVEILKMLYRDNEIMIFDEPTAVLTPQEIDELMQIMRSLVAEGKSILFITHDLGVVAEVCDDVVVMYSGRVVEKGDVRSIFANPSHPYTRGLLASIPKLGEYAEELESIPGNVPNPKYMPQGCKFAPRCSCAFDKCREEEPGFYDVGGGHMSRCWLCEKKGGDA